MRTPEQVRRDQNADTLAKFKRGESLSLVDSTATWWPPRPIIKKDQEGMAKLYGTQVPDMRRETDTKRHNTILALRNVRDDVADDTPTQTV